MQLIHPILYATFASMVAANEHSPVQIRAAILLNPQIKGLTLPLEQFPQAAADAMRKKLGNNAVVTAYDWVPVNNGNGAVTSKDFRYKGVLFHAISFFEFCEVHATGLRGAPAPDKWGYAIGADCSYQKSGAFLTCP